MIYQLANKIADILQADPGMAQVQVWSIQEGALNQSQISCAVGYHESSFAEYDRLRDEAQAMFTVNIHSPEARNANGDLVVAVLADTARLCLCENYALGGLAANSYVERIEFGTAPDQLEPTTAELYLWVKYYAVRARAPNVPTVAQIQPDIQKED